MQYTQGQVGRVFALRLEHGERMPDTLERFLREQGVTHGMAIMVGGADGGSQFVVGPEDSDTLPPKPVVNSLEGAHEAAAVGTIFPGEDGMPALHMHAAFGRGDETKSGCIRAGIVTWHVLELVVIEITGLEATRKLDPATGLALLQCGSASLQ